MRAFDYTTLPTGLLTARTMNLLSAIHEHRGRQVIQRSLKPDVLTALTEVAKAQSTDASNRIEGIRTSSDRLKAIMSESTVPRTRDEEEIAGYRDVLSTVHANYQHLDVSPNVILQLHRDLYRHTPSSLGGRFKVGENEIRGVRPDGTEYVRFRPVPDIATPDAMDRLCRALHAGLASDACDPLLVALMFIFDFTCVHPFNDENGRMSRLLTVLLLYQQGYTVGRYISIEQEIVRTKEAYYDALARSSVGWTAGRNDPAPFVHYMLGVILAAYRDLEQRIKGVSELGLSKAERVEATIRDALGKVTKADILSVCPDISKVTVERALAALVRSGSVIKVGAGPATGYVWRGPSDATSARRAQPDS